MTMDELVDCADRDRAKEMRRERSMLRMSRRALHVVILLAVLVGIDLTAYTALQSPPQPIAALTAPASVTVSLPLQKRMASWTTFTGQFSAVDRVEIRAQVGGYLTEIDFKDGQAVKKGDLLFVIDPRPYEIALADTHAQLETAQASLSLSKKQLSRTTELMRSDFASQETLDQRKQQQEAADATVDQAKARVRAAELNMEWTHVVAPLSGRISSHRISVGNLVTGGQSSGAATLLTTIVSLDPIYLDFDMGESDYVAYQRFLHSSHDQQTVDRTVDFAISDEAGWKHKGRLDFLDNEMDHASGTIHARATVPNPDLFLAAGQFARLRLPTTAAADTLLVPDAALSMDQSRAMLMTVAPDGSVVPKVVDIGAVVGDLRVVKRGIERDDRVIINGLMFAEPYAKVTPKPGVISDVPDQG
jgi:RND family efflux transporter MFP subunit